jgi:ATP-dependent DNA helicase RecG
MPKVEQLWFSLESRVRLLSPDEIYDLAGSELIKQLDEDRRIERKPAGIHQKTLGHYLSMWANTPSSGGVIVIGVENDGGISGLSKVGVSHLNDLERTGDICCPDAKHETKRINVTNSSGNEDEILLIRVHYNGKKVVRTTDGMAFDRRGESKRSLTEEQIRELQIEKGELSWELEPTKLKFPDEFDGKALGKFAQAVIDTRRLEHTKGVQDILVHRHLGSYEKGKFLPNKACTLLFGNDPKMEVSGGYIRFLRFDGKDEGLGEKRNQVKDEWIEGNLPTQLDQAELLIGAQLREFSRLGKDGKFITTQEYPKAAWLEAVVNAVVHRSYNIQNVPIFIKMFDDRLEIESPGGFMPYVTPENIYDRHDPRNPNIMEALFFLDRVKCTNEGTKRMRETMKELDLPEPIFRQLGAGNPKVTVILKNNVEHRKVWLDSDVSKVVGEALFRQLSEHEKRIANYLAEYERINVTEAIRITGKAWETCKGILDGLCVRGVLRHIHSKKEKDSKAHYVLSFSIKKSN